MQKIKTKKRAPRKYHPSDDGVFRTVVLSTLHTIKSSPLYVAAKAGNADAAFYMICDTLRKRAPIVLPEIAGATLVPVLADGSTNAIPSALCRYLAVSNDVVIDDSFLVWREECHQKEKGALARLLVRGGVSGGIVPAGRRFVIVDDFLTTGRTVQMLRLHIICRGGYVPGAVVLGTRTWSTPLLQTAETMRELARFDRRQLDAALGYLGIYDADSLTNSEAKYLLQYRRLEDFTAAAILKRKAKEMGVEYDEGRRKREFCRSRRADVAVGKAGTVCAESAEE